jgi:hypothetical protein
MLFTFERKFLVWLEKMCLHFMVYCTENNFCMFVLAIKINNEKVTKLNFF